MNTRRVPASTVEQPKTPQDNDNSRTTFGKWLTRLKMDYGFDISGDNADVLACQLIKLTEKYGNKFSLTGLIELYNSLMRQPNIVPPRSTKESMPLRQWMILFVATQKASKS